MSIIVDGYNYIGRSRELSLSDPAASDKIIYLMGQYCGKVKKTLTLVFDGSYFPHLVNRKRHYGRVTVIYTSPIYTADHAIKRMIKNQEYRRRRSLLVVSSDEEILEYASSHGTKVLKSEDFEHLISQTLAGKKGIDRVNIQISDQEVQEWLKIFAPDSHESSSRHEKHRFPSPGKQQPRSQQPVEEAHKAQDLKKRKKKPISSAHADNRFDRINVHLSSREIQEWMDIFGVDEEDE